MRQLQALTKRTIASGGVGRGSVYEVPSNPEQVGEILWHSMALVLTLLQATYARDALAKSLYSRLFDYIVARVNESMYTEARYLLNAEET